MVDIRQGQPCSQSMDAAWGDWARSGAGFGVGQNLAAGARDALGGFLLEAVGTA